MIRKSYDLPREGVIVAHFTDEETEAREGVSLAQGDTAS